MRAIPTAMVVMNKGDSKNSTSSFSLWEKVGMRVLKLESHTPLPEGEGIFRACCSYMGVL
jgi:hypothetical protein